MALLPELMSGAHININKIGCKAMILIFYYQ